MAIAYNRYAEANIPVSYWDLDMKDFQGPKALKDVADRITTDLGKTYREGYSVCLAGQHGVGKTYIATNIIKKACQKNYICLYSDMLTIVSALTSNTEKYAATKELITVDFLVIDELDQRFIANDNVADLFGRLFEHILRTRLQNEQPTIICSNSPNPIETFTGALKDSIGSIMSKVPIVPIMGNDFRKQSK